MASHRIERLNEDVRRELSAALSRMKDERLNSFLSVMRVDITSDLSYAKVRIGSLKGGEEAKAACELLKKASGHLRSEIARHVKMRKIPELIFVPDDSTEYYNHINSILEGLKNDSGNDGI